MLVDLTQNYGAAFYSCAVGMGLSAVCLALVGPAKSGMCQTPSGDTEEEESGSQNSEQQDFLEVDVALEESPVRRAVDQDSVI